MSYAEEDTCGGGYMHVISGRGEGYAGDAGDAPSAL
jgi:hypothetical protein